MNERKVVKMLADSTQAAAEEAFDLTSPEATDARRTYMKKNILITAPCLQPWWKNLSRQPADRVMV